jgi:DNA-binding NarL/FixJ family response regulator
MTQSAFPIRILLVDDHAVVRAGIRQFLEQAADIQVVAEASSGEEALRLLESQHPDVAVLDIQMPQLNGIEVARRMRTSSHPVGILMLTAYDDDPFVAAALKAGANGYILKTASPQTIIQAVRDVAEGQAALDPAIARKLIQQFSSRSTSGVEELTGRELEVLERAGRGLTNKAIGLELSISDRTVQNHLARIYEKLQAASRTEAVMRAVSLGWLPSTLGEIPEN